MNTTQMYQDDPKPCLTH